MAMSFAAGSSGTERTIRVWMNTLGCAPPGLVAPGKQRPPNGFQSNPFPKMGVVLSAVDARGIGINVDQSLAHQSHRPSPPRAVADVAPRSDGAYRGDHP
jgi:hypothetical protein